MINRGEPLRVDFTGRFIYYVGLVDPVRDECRRPGWPDHRHADGQVHPHDAGEDRPARHGRQVERGPTAIDAIRDNKAVYLMASAARRIWRRRRSAARGGVRRPRHGGDLRVTLAITAQPSNLPAKQWVQQAHYRRSGRQYQTMLNNPPSSGSSLKRRLTVSTHVARCLTAVTKCPTTTIQTQTNTYLSHRREHQQNSQESTHIFKSLINEPNPNTLATQELIFLPTPEQHTT